jgi:hypothetical protein
MADSVPDHMRKITTLIGITTLSWAWAENSLAMAIAIIDRCEGPMRRHKRLPTAMSQRLDYLTVALVDVVALEPVIESGKALKQRFADLKVRRNELVHGAASHVHQDTFQYTILTVEGRKQTVESQSFEPNDVFLFNIEVLALADMAMAFLKSILKIYPQEPTERRPVTLG